MKFDRTVVKKVILYGILLSFSFIFLIPFFWMISTSLKSPDKIFVIPPQWIPTPLVWENYPKAIAFIPFLTYLKNTLIITSLCILGVILSSSLVAYSFARLDWPGREFFFVILLSTLMLPAQVTMIPVFVLFKNLNWIDTLKPLIVPAFFGNAAFIFLIRQYFRTIPRDLEDSARIDGCSSFRIYWNIMLPISKSVLATVGIFTFIGTWNDFLGPLIYLNSTEKKTLALGLQSFVSQYGTEWSMLMAVSTLMLIPILILFFLGQRYFVQGITLTGLKA